MAERASASEGAVARRAAILLALALLALAGAASAQRRHRDPPPPPPVPYDAVVQWTVFVSAYGDQAARRTVASAEPGSIPIPMEGWQCTYSAPTRARVNDTNWSEVRTLECTRGDALISTTGFCQIAGPSWGARAGVLSLGALGNPSRVQVTLDCSVVN
jgi:hypothetical protein